MKKYYVIFELNSDGIPVKIYRSIPKVQSNCFDYFEVAEDALINHYSNYPEYTGQFIILPVCE